MVIHSPKKKKKGGSTLRLYKKSNTTLYSTASYEVICQRQEKGRLYYGAIEDTDKRVSRRVQRFKHQHSERCQRDVQDNRQKNP